MKLAPTVTNHKFSQRAAAQRLGVTREHLNRVLRGHRQSRSLIRRYQALKQEVA